MTSNALTAFGLAVRKARIDKDWTLANLSEVLFDTPDRKSFLSQIENGKRNLSPLTVAALARELNLSEAVTTPLLSPSGTDEVTPEDTAAEELVERAQADPFAPHLAESLLISLAYEFAGKRNATVDDAL